MLLFNGVRMFPNPVRWQLQVDNRYEENINYTIRNMLGVTVREGILTKGRTNIDVYNLPQGIYMIALQDQEGNIQTRKVVKE
jgi:hypothetical protein